MCYSEPCNVNTVSLYTGWKLCTCAETVICYGWCMIRVSVHQEVLGAAVLCRLMANGMNVLLSCLSSQKRGWEGLSIITFNFPLILFSVTASTLSGSIATTVLTLLTSKPSVCLCHRCHLTTTLQQRRRHWSPQTGRTSVAAWCTYWRTWASSKRTTNLVLSGRAPPCCLTSSVCCLGAPSRNFCVHTLPVYFNRSVCVGGGVLL